MLVKSLLSSALLGALLAHEASASVAHDAAQPALVARHQRIERRGRVHEHSHGLVARSGHLAKRCAAPTKSSSEDTAAAASISSRKAEASSKASVLRESASAAGSATPTVPASEDFVTTTSEPAVTSSSSVAYDSNARVAAAAQITTAAPTSTSKSSKKEQPTSSSSSSSKKQKASSSSSSQKAAETQSSSSSSSSETKSGDDWLSSDVQGLIGFSASNCGASGADSSNPNGANWWLTCGISKDSPDSPWTPPEGVTAQNIAYVSIDEALSSNHVWEPCKPYKWIFEKYAEQINVPPILLASFALQESTCNPSVTGGGGEVGLMQITQDKCGSLDSSACRDPETNVRIAAQYFKQTLDNVGGKFLVALGAYNGWQPGMSYNSATAARYSGCCRCQNNLDYLEQMLSGWVMGKTGYSLGTYNNLAVCG